MQLTGKYIDSVIGWVKMLSVIGILSDMYQSYGFTFYQ